MQEIIQHIQFNALKHHLFYIHKFLTEQHSFIPHSLSSIGNSQMDMYCGQLSISELFNSIEVQLHHRKIDTKDAFIREIDNTLGYLLLTLRDTSVWVLRLSDDTNQYIHLHPARYSPHTFRVHATTLKTALAIRILKLDFSTLNSVSFNQQVRLQLGLSPVKNKADLKAVKKILAYLAPM